MDTAKASKARFAAALSSKHLNRRIPVLVRRSGEVIFIKVDVSGGHGADHAARLNECKPFLAMMDNHP
jgi:hypothetical protein